MTLFFPTSVGYHSVLRVSFFSFPSVPVRRIRNSLFLGGQANSTGVERNGSSSGKSSGGDKIDNLGKGSDMWEESCECVEVIVVGSRKDAMLDFYSGSPLVSPVLRF